MSLTNLGCKSIEPDSIHIGIREDEERDLDMIERCPDQLDEDLMDRRGGERAFEDAPLQSTRFAAGTCIGA